MKQENIRFKLIHTGQHYDFRMSKLFFKDLEIPEPDINLDVGSCSHAVQTARIMIEFEKCLLKDKPSLVIVVGDVNSTLACSLTAKKLGIKIAHIEAGLRSFDMNMPEEINRILTDHLSDYLFVSEKSGLINLKKEGIDSGKVFLVGNIMIENLINNLEKAKNQVDHTVGHNIDYNLGFSKYALTTFHRPENVDSKENLEKVIDVINFVQEQLKVIFILHPRTEKNIDKYNLRDKFQKNVYLSKPLGYLQFLYLMLNAKLIITDSGGIQEEASFLRIPVLTARETTERPITVEKGTNTITGTNLEIIRKKVVNILLGNYKKGQKIAKWDSSVSKRIIRILTNLH